MEFFFLVMLALVSLNKEVDCKTTPVEHPPKHPTEHPPKHPTEHPSEHPAEHPTEHPSEHPSERPLKRPLEHPVEHPPQKRQKKSHSALSIIFPHTGTFGMVGFAKKGLTTGGTGGKVVFVTSLSSLQEHLCDPESSILVLTENIISNETTIVEITANKTLVGSWKAHVIYNVYFTTNPTSGNFIFQNIVFKHDKNNINNDQTQVKLLHGGRYWIDHCNFNGGEVNTNDLGKLLKVSDKVNFVTISNSKFLNHMYGLIFGHPEPYKDEYNGFPRVTIMFNHFENLQARGPGLMRYGVFHVFNNYINRCHLGFTIGYNSKIFSQHNYFLQSKKYDEVIDDKGDGYFTDVASFENIHQVQKSKPLTTWDPSKAYKFKMTTPEVAREIVLKYAGVQKKSLVFGGQDEGIDWCKNALIILNKEVDCRVVPKKKNSKTSGPQQSNLFPHTGTRGMVGFAKIANTTGGRGGKIIHIESLPTLQKYLTVKEPAILILTKNIISDKLKVVTIGTDKTLVGSWKAHYIYNVYLVTSPKSGNFILQNIIFKHNTKNIGNDETQIKFLHGTRYWIDHCTFDGTSVNSNDLGKLFKVSDKANFVTISNSKFQNHMYGLIFGHPEPYKDEYNGFPKVTIMFNHFENLQARGPGLMRYGIFHVYNNYINRCHIGFTIGYNSKIYSQHNYFHESKKYDEVLDDKGDGYFTDVASFENVHQVQKSKHLTTWDPSKNYQFNLTSPESAKEFTIKYAGAQTKYLEFGGF